MVSARLKRRLLTVVDTLGLDDERRRRHLSLAREMRLPAILVVFDVPEQVARQRNRERKAGFDGISLMDHLMQIPQVGREWEELPEVFGTLGFLAGRTSKLSLGALVTNVRLRNPALLAKMLATIDVLSGGRSFCGLGAGWFKSEQVAYGYEFEAPGRRLDRLEDALAILPLM